MIPRLATDAVATGSDHAGAEFVEDLERRLVSVQAKLALELDGRDAWRMARNQVGGPERARGFGAEIISGGENVSPARALPGIDQKGCEHDGAAINADFAMPLF